MKIAIAGTGYVGLSLAVLLGKQEIAAKAQALYSSDRMCREYVEIYTKDLFGRD